MDDFEIEIKKEFINEALINLEEAESSFMELERSSDPKPLLDKIFRLAHNLKGGSRAVGFAQVAEFTHQFENLVQKIQKDEIPLTSSTVTTLLRANDLSVEMLTALSADLDARVDDSGLLAEIQALIAGEGSSLSKEGEAQLQSLDEVPSDVMEAPPAAADFFQAAMSEAPAPEIAVSPAEAVATDKKNENEVIRVNLSRINLLNDFVGELIVLQSVIQEQAAEGNQAKLHASIRQMTKLSKDIQNLSMSLRMLPVKPLIQKLQRVVRDTGNALDREIEFHVSGDQMEIDKSVLDRLADPLIHILRNAIDHGIEAKDERIRSGKPVAGRIRLSLFNEGNHLIVEVRDNGKGIDGEALRKKAVERKIVGETQQLTEKQLVNLIFHPGFSTKSEASEISGRGVGMDVVRTNIEKIGGHVDVQTVIGEGTTFRLQIPLSLAVIDGLVVRSGPHRYVIPLNQVEETVNLKSQNVYVQKAGIGNCFNLRGTVIPLWSVDEALGAKKSEIGLEGTALIVMVDDRPMGIVVEDILQAQQIVIKPLGNGIVTQKGWVGSCILGDGLPTLILSPIDLLSGKVSYGFSEPVLGEVV